jgi:aspartyl-tRNA(Asn)/glutamyl-tRNA(Gln) amidotransferase subunit C
VSLTPKDIHNIAHLARLQLSESEAAGYVTSLSRIIDLVGELEQADTHAVAPMSHPLPGLTQRLRADVVKDSDQHERYQQNAPQVQAGLYLVPKVIE